MPRVRKKTEIVSDVKKREKTTSRALVKKVPKAQVTQSSALVSKKKQPDTKTAKKLKKAGERVSVRIVLQETEPEVRVAIQDKTKQQKQILQTQVLEKPLVPSPYRFPLVVPGKETLQLVARVVAFFFIVFGTLSSIFTLSSFSVIGEQMPASTLTASSSDSSTTGISNTPSLDPKPEARLIVDAGDFLTGLVPMTVTVPYAQEVKIVAEDRAESRFLVLGIASKIDNSSWRYAWNTTAVHDGLYRIKLVIRNEFGVYEETDSEEYEVRNMHQTEGATEATSTTPENDVVDENATTTTAQTVLKPDLVLPSNTIISNTLSLKVFIADASEVKLYAKNTGTLASYYVGRATKHDEREWRINWDSTKVPNGVYAIRAVALLGTLQSESSVKNITVRNEQNTGSTTGVIATTTTERTVLEPRISVTISEDDPISGTTDVLVETQGVQWVEVYVRQKNGLTPLFLGLAQKQSDTLWKYTWNTKNSPNGEYELYTRVRTPYGFTEGERYEVKILNEIAESLTKNQESEVEQLTTLNKALTKETDGEKSITVLESDEMLPDAYSAPKVVYIEPVPKFVERTLSDDDVLRKEVEEKLLIFKEKLNDANNAFSKATRMHDEEEMRRIEVSIQDLKRSILQDLPQSSAREKLITDVDTYLSQIIFETLEMTKNNERILKERAGDAVLTDSDKDGISNYDEINLYKTNPYSADTDGDGYIDGIELERGYDPHNSNSEALVTYESPKDSGVVREDLLTVETVTSITLDPSEALTESGKTPVQGLISGMGLPNSFVTIYIFSTPVVVTVRTDAEGNWSYILEKELEEGEHTVYVGITDNAGRIVAKSKPLQFIKTAEAYTEAVGIGITTSEEGMPSMFNKQVLFLLASVLVLILGLVLVIIGVHLNRQSKQSDGTLPSPI